MRAASTLVLAAVVLLAGCSEKNPVSAPESSTEDVVWVGAISGPSAGDVVVSVHIVGAGVTGGVVLQGPDYRGLTGAFVHDSLLLALNGGGVLRARLGGASLDTLSGWLDLGSGAGNFVLRRVPRLPVTTLATVVQSFPIFDLGWDGTLLWAAGSESHIRTTLGGTVVDTVVVYVRDAQWVATVAGWDGARMWGVFPLTILGPGFSENAAELLGYDAQGRTGDSVYVAHRPSGLAHDGTALWSLRSDPPALLRLNAAGGTAESLHVEVPDATKLAWDGANFWVLSWHLGYLCRLDADGNLEAMFTLPHDATFGLSGLVYDGSEFVFSETGFGTPLSHLHRVIPRFTVPLDRNRVAARVLGAR